MQAAESFFPIHSDTIATSKAIPRSRSSNKSHMTHPKPELSMFQTVSKVDNSDHPALESRQ